MFMHLPGIVIKLCFVVVQCFIYEIQFKIPKTAESA